MDDIGAMAIRNKSSESLLVTCFFKPENGGYVVRCIELDITSEGDTFEEAEKNIFDAIALYLSEYGVPPELSSKEKKPNILVPMEVPI